MKHTPRVGGADLNYNPYYNAPEWACGKGCKQQGVNYQCVQYLFQRVQEDCEKRVVYYTSRGESKSICEKPLFNRSGVGNGCEWYKDAKWSKTTNPSEVREGDIVCYGTGWGGGYGHVRYVEKIEGNYMYLSGGNETFNGGAKFNIKCIIAQGGGENATGLQGYIHNDLLDQPKTKDYKSLYEEYKSKYEEAQSKLNKIKNIL